MTKRALRHQIDQLEELHARERDAATMLRERLDTAKAKLDVVAELHQPRFAFQRIATPAAVALSFKLGDSLLMCKECVSAWPCETYRSLADVPAGRVTYTPDEEAAK